MPYPILHIIVIWYRHGTSLKSDVLLYCGAETHHFPSFYPIGIYSIPEISCCGYTEDRLREMGFNYEVGRAYYYEIARSHIAGGSTGMIKIVFHAETLEILGVHAIGRNATEYIHVG